MKLTTFPSKILNLIAYLQQKSSHIAADLAQFVMDLQLEPTDLQNWIDYDHPKRHSYGRTLVHAEDYFEIMVMSWAPGDYSAVHDHGQTQWGIVQTFGPSEHSVYQLQGSTLVFKGRVRQNPGDVICVDHELIHQMGNPSTQQAFLSLHVYGGEESQGAITRKARVFDIWNNRITRVDGGVFYALPQKGDHVSQQNLVASPFLRYLDGVELYLRIRQGEGEPGEEPGTDPNSLYRELEKLGAAIEGQTPAHLLPYYQSAREKLHKKRS
jgi:cysteine dioxygenase